MTQGPPSRVLSINNPLTAPGVWLKGGLHVHTTGSDGTLTPEETLRKYRGLGFDFLAIADHDRVTIPGEIPAGMTWLPGVEYAKRIEEAPGGQWHIVSVGTEKCLVMSGYPVKNILKLLHEVSPFVIVAHPYWSNQGGEDMVKLPPYDAQEVFNYGSERSLERGNSEIFWDYVLSAGRRPWGIASDDAHRLEDVGATWLKVRAADSSREAIIAALKAGAFYSSTGPDFLEVRVDGKGVSVQTTPVRSISFVADRQRGAFFPAEAGTTITEASYAFKGNESYVRVQVTDEHGNSAWTNPLCFWDSEITQNEAK